MAIVHVDFSIHRICKLQIDEVALFSGQRGIDDVGTDGGREERVVDWVVLDDLVRAVIF
jgi:hypothetical protein